MVLWSDCLVFYDYGISVPALWCPLTPPSSYLGFSYLGRGVSLHSCSSKAQPLLLTLDQGYFLTAAPPDLERGVAPLGPPAPGSSHSLEVGLLLSATAPDLGRDSGIKIQIKLIAHVFVSDLTLGSLFLCLVIVSWKAEFFFFFFLTTSYTLLYSPYRRLSFFTIMYRSYIPCPWDPAIRLIK